jgi:hypothetical protein
MIKLLLALALLCLPAFATNIIYDVTIWTKRDWEKYKIRNPIDFNPADAYGEGRTPVLTYDLREALTYSKQNSIDGPFARRSGSKVPV